MKTDSLVISDAALYREMLLAEKMQLLEELAFESSELAVSEHVPDDDRPAHIHDQFVTLHHQDMAYQTLKLIESALDRLAVGDFGICIGCGEAISPRRLTAIPWAQYCILCQERNVQEVEKADEIAA
jgi:RNA polymerase-binding protein DksA